MVKWPKTPASHAGNSGSNPLRVTMIYQVAKELWIFRSEQSVSLAMRVHPFPSRTRQLSSSVLTILGWKRPGKIRRCRHKQKQSRRKICGFLFLFFRNCQIYNRGDILWKTKAAGSFSCPTLSTEPGSTETGSSLTKSSEQNRCPPLGSDKAKTKAFLCATSVNADTISQSTD